MAIKRTYQRLLAGKNDSVGILDMPFASIAIVAIAFLFTFEHAILAWLPAFRYSDEIFAIGALFAIVMRCGKIDREDLVALLLCALVLFLGLVGNWYSALLNDKAAILLDVLSTFKVLAAYFVIRVFSPSEEVCECAYLLGASVSRVIVVVAFFFLLVSQVVDLGMLAGHRLGLSSFAFVFNKIPGNFSKVFYLVIPLLVIDLRRDRSLLKRIVFIMALMVWCSTLRSRAFAFCAATIVLIVWFAIQGKRERSSSIVVFLNVVLLLSIVLVLTWDQLLFYFTDEGQARGNLLRYAIVTANDFFPLGSGFGAYGSNVASDNYSSLYRQYGFDRIYGMTETQGMFLNDNYWPMIVGQFGYLGLAAMVFALFVVCRRVVVSGQSWSYSQLGAILLVGYLLVSSIASKSYCEFSSIGIFAFMGLLVCHPPRLFDSMSKKQADRCDFDAKH